MTVTREEPRWAEAGWERLAPGVGRLRLPVWDCTAGLVAGPAGALLVDAGSSPAEGTRLREETGRLLGGGRRVTHLALTHAHFDHVFGASAFADAEVFGAVGLDAVLAHGREELRADAVRNGQDPGVAREAADALLLPRLSGASAVDLGGGLSAVPVGVGPGHTSHDLAVVVRSTSPGSRPVVFCGDLVEESGEPQAGLDAVPSHWPAALDRLLALGGEEAVYVPGHGAAVDAAFVRAQRDALTRRFGVP
ncbi:MBL fold metallo-hydrolase [Streptomyces sp. NPDC008313]|uniref:MBL fold metallo-hydrolase n=1 Tax=Streptomyces sp. NPDC008313 TaxID=3364826 RepID=UPI0036E44398